MKMHLEVTELMFPSAHQEPCGTWRRTTTQDLGNIQCNRKEGDDELTSSCISSRLVGLSISISKHVCVLSSSSVVSVLMMFICVDVLFRRGCGVQLSDMSAVSSKELLASTYLDGE